MFQNIHFISDLPQSFCGKKKVALVSDMTTRTSRSKAVDEVRATILANVIKRDFLKEILRERRKDKQS
jgi:ribosomal protein L19E